MGLEVLDCTEKQASRDPGWGGGKEERMDSRHQSLICEHPHPIRFPSLGACEQDLGSLRGLSSSKAEMINNDNDSSGRYNTYLVFTICQALG